MNKNKKVLLAMSGGTDSSVAAMLLLEQGYEVVGVTFRFFEVDENTTYIQDTKSLAERLAFKHITHDVREPFTRDIVGYFVEEYMAGRTPVPCVICNNTYKWPLLIQIADELGIFNIASGHYVQKVELNGKYYIKEGVDEDKDQSFFLWGLSQDILKRMVLPLGGFTKIQVREMAAARGFEKVAVKKDSLGVCFCPGDYRSFLRSRLPSENFKQGNYLDINGNVIGKHEGFPFYTVGQRRGLGLNLDHAVYVKDINPLKNEVILAPHKALYKDEMIIKDINIINTDDLLEPVICKIRYRKQATPCIVTLLPEKKALIKFLTPLDAIAPGQSCVLYRHDILLGGGIIESSK